MPVPNPNSADHPVIIFVPHGGDARGAADILGKEGIHSEIMQSIEEFCARANERAGALLLTEEVITDKVLPLLLGVLQKQPVWSDLPLVLLTKNGETSPQLVRALSVMDLRVNLTLLERPLRGFTLVSVIKTALRSRRHQYEVRELLSSYALAVDGAQMGPWDWNVRTGVVQHSVRHDQMFGYPEGKDEWTTDTSLAHVLAEDRELVRKELEEAPKRGWLYVEFRVRWPDNSVHWISSQGRVYDGLDGKPERISGVVMDITERREREIAARIERERLDVVLEGTDVGLWYWDLPENKMIWNVRCKEMHGMTAITEPTMERFSAQVRPEHVEHLGVAMKQSLENGGLYDQEYQTVENKWLRAVGRVFFDSKGTPLRFDGITMDITQRKLEDVALREAQEKLMETAEQLELRVKERTAELEEAVAEMEAFSYSVSHDLRAPLRAMQGYAQALGEEYGEKLDANAAEYLKRIAKNAERLDRLTQDLLTYSRVVRAPIEMTTLNTERLIGDVIQQYPAFRSANLEIEVRSPLANVVGHDASLTQCISNLIGNAIKFVLPGKKPHITIWTESTGNQVRIYFKDNGIGIEKEQMNRLFKMFERLDKKYEGTGIGLAIVKKAAQRMNGTVTVESTPGAGSTFCVELQAAHE